MKRLLLTAIVMSFTAIIAKSQTEGVMEYKPIPLYGEKEAPADKSLTNSATTIDAYYLNTYTNKPVKVKLKVVENKYGVFIIGCKRLTDYHWADLSSEPIKTSTLLPTNPLAEYFERKAFISRLQQTIYF
ncbi:hypothetical protein [Pedobacter psychroterrae]|uniref:Uncharacterized protein n=1 Tax=Pedobacter psychroterrae TaxID=2530453 RepID=A0A4R0NCI9_9SPHI|nr:hypothetical protein [Pedobacter psychroterrae]TCC98040.1 hypothetical protein EZ437_19540 [Pedobacter psychroterrae]